MTLITTGKIRRYGVLALLALAVCSPVCAEFSVTLTINGDLDEILAIVQQLKRMGLGEGIQFEADDPLKLRVHSVHENAESAVEAPVDPEPPVPEPVEAAPVLALDNAAVYPASVPPGAGVLVTVEVTDKEHLIDTLAATLGSGGPTVDLYDNGTGGDVTAGDGIWSASLLIPAETAPGEMDVVITAYDANGSPIMVLMPDYSLTRITAAVTVTVSP
jgi:hypothetical protein